MEFLSKILAHKFVKELLIIKYLTHKFLLCLTHKFLLCLVYEIFRSCKISIFLPSSPFFLIQLPLLMSCTCEFHNWLSCKLQHQLNQFLKRRRSRHPICFVAQCQPFMFFLHWRRQWDVGVEHRQVAHLRLGVYLQKLYCNNPDRPLLLRNNLFRLAPPPPAWPSWDMQNPCRRRGPVKA